MLTQDTVGHTTPKIQSESKSSEWTDIGQESEIWKPVKDYEGFYEVSNLGNVRSIPRETRRKHQVKGIMRQSVRVGFYLGVNLSKDNEQKMFLVHRLVALAFIPNPNNYPIVNHLNLIKYDNRVANLEWCSHSQNTRHAFDNNRGKVRYGEDSNLSIVTLNEVQQIRNKHLNGTSQLELAEEYGIGQSGINQIINNKNWFDEKYQIIVDSQEFKDRKQLLSLKGELNHRSKLKANQIIEIRSLYETGEYNYSQLAIMFGVSTTNICDIIKKKIWRHI